MEISTTYYSTNYYNFGIGKAYRNYGAFISVFFYITVIHVNVYREP